MEANALAGNKNSGTREKDDFYPTPPHATNALLDRIEFKGDIWEPACGDGAISEVLTKHGYKVYSSDLFDRGYGEPGIDFLKVSEKNVVPFSSIITNPPYKIAKEFVEKSLEVTDDKVAMLLKLNFLESVNRYGMFKSTPLKHVFVFSKRLTFYEPNSEKKGKSGVLAYAWYVWEHGYTGNPQIDWII
ncbi:NAD(P)-dependent oxidoreductase [Ornithinibacillus xuwenensis]|uniref:NAD(P)-dependent oxidoreductase n=1 Tax=Ornithinibacillus xuwenensis TaxID=3144668 RepID=A0ABU9XBV7_9BACI